MDRGGSAPDLDAWLRDPALRVAHRRQSTATPDELWTAAGQIRLADTGVLGRMVRWRIPGLARDVVFDGLFREPPFVVLDAGPRVLVSGLVGRIWTLRRDYPKLETTGEFLQWDRRGTARVVFANWVEPVGDGGAALHAEVRAQAYGVQGRTGLAAVRPLVNRFQGLVGSEGLRAAVRRAEQHG